MRLASSLAALDLRRISAGWWVVFASLPLIVYTSAAVFFTPGLLIKEFQDEFGWSVAAMALAFSFQRLEGGISAPIVGYFIDRVGGQRILILGLVLMGAGLVMISRISALWHWYAAFLLLSTGGGMGTVGTVTAMVVKWMERRRGLALGIVMSANGLGALLLPVMALLMREIGWRNAIAVLGIGLWVLCIPLALLVKDKPPDLSMVAATGEKGKAGKPKIPMRAILRSHTFWIISFATASFGFHYSSLLVFIIPHLQEAGFSRESAAGATALLYALSMPARIVLGFAADYVSVKKLYAGSFLFMAIGLVLFAQVTAFWHIVVFAIVYGWAQGCFIAVGNTLLAELFGTDFFATIRGMTQPLALASGVAGPLLIGLVFDATDSYKIAFYVFAAVLVLPAPFLLLVRPIQMKPPAPTPPATAT